ncbi:MAG: hypothetical protein M5R42_06425 [Rhodocyclaceae bacterium]|nr:hypothetical protein [Rhodocyclaceae bacterium]
MTRTLVFLYESLAQLVFAYPSRRISAEPMPNRALHLAVLFGAGLQILTVTVPSLRELLGLEAIEWRAALAMMVAVLVQLGRGRSSRQDGVAPRGGARVDGAAVPQQLTFHERGAP